MNAKDFLRCVAAVMPGTPSATRSAALGRLDARLSAEFPHARFTAGLADAVAARLSGFPDWLALAAAVREALAQSGDTAQPEAPRTGEAGSWLRFLAEGDAQPMGQRTGILHRLSVVRSYGGDAWFDAARIYAHVLRQHRPDWLPEAEAERFAERRRIAETWQPQSVLDAAPPPIGPIVKTRPTAAAAAPARSAASDAALLAHLERLEADGNEIAATRAAALRARLAASA